MDVKTRDAGLLQSRYRLTKQRAAVLRALGDGTHLSAETIFARVRNELPGVSLGTIYRTLDILRQVGLVQIFSFGGIAARYEAALEKHHHAICSDCHELRNLYGDGVGAIAHAMMARSGYTDIDYSLTIVGHCPTCSASSRAAVDYAAVDDATRSSTIAGRSSSSGGSSPKA